MWTGAKSRPDGNVGLGVKFEKSVTVDRGAVFEANKKGALGPLSLQLFGLVFIESPLYW